MLEKLLRLGSLNTTVGHLVHHQVILFASSRGQFLPSVIRCVAPAFLGCWAFITPTLISRFQQDDHLVFLDAMAHVKTNIYPF
jgi:hypothetical protein